MDASMSMTSKLIANKILSLMIFLLLLLHCGMAYAETKRVTAEGESEECRSRKKARKEAEKDTIENAREECDRLGPNWGYAGVIFEGYEQFKRCGNTERFKCYITQAIHKCSNNTEYQEHSSESSVNSSGRSNTLSNCTKKQVLVDGVCVNAKDVKKKSNIDDAFQTLEGDSSSTKRSKIDDAFATIEGGSSSTIHSKIDAAFSSLKEEKLVYNTASGGQPSQPQLVYDTAAGGQPSQPQLVYDSPAGGQPSQSQLVYPSPDKEVQRKTISQPEVKKNSEDCKVVAGCGTPGSVIVYSSGSQVPVACVKNRTRHQRAVRSGQPFDDLCSNMLEDLRDPAERGYNASSCYCNYPYCVVFYDRSPAGVCEKKIE